MHEEKMAPFINLKRLFTETLQIIGMTVEYLHVSQSKTLMKEVDINLTLRAWKVEIREVEWA